MEILLLALGGLPLLHYGAVAADTIGGMNWLATLLAAAAGGLGLILGLVGLRVKELSNWLARCAVVGHAALIAGAVAMLMTREHHMGYGPQLRVEGASIRPGKRFLRATLAQGVATPAATRRPQKTQGALVSA